MRMKIAVVTKLLTKAAIELRYTRLTVIVKLDKKYTYKFFLPEEFGMKKLEALTKADLMRPSVIFEVLDEAVDLLEEYYPGHEKSITSLEILIADILIKYDAFIDYYRKSLLKSNMSKLEVEDLVDEEHFIFNIYFGAQV